MAELFFNVKKIVYFVVSDAVQGRGTQSSPILKKEIDFRPPARDKQEAEWMWLGYLGRSKKKLNLDSFSENVTPLGWKMRQSGCFTVFFAQPWSPLVRKQHCQETVSLQLFYMSAMMNVPVTLHL